jgi:hypothetical protein
VKTATRLYIEQGHARVEARQYHVLDATDIAKVYPDWAGLKNLGMAMN